MKKRWLVALLMAILLLSACGAFESSGRMDGVASSDEGNLESAISAQEKQKIEAPAHEDRRAESQVGSSVHFVDETLDHHIYYAYHPSGELMFTVRENYRNAAAGYVEKMNLYYGGSMQTYTIPAPESGVIVENQWTLDGTRLLRKNNYSISELRWEDSEMVVKLVPSGFTEANYAEDGLSYELGSDKYILDEEGKVLEIISQSGEREYNTAYTYDEYGNVLTCSINSDQGEQTISNTYKYNEYGQPLTGRCGNSLDTYDYFCIQDLADQEKEFLDFLEPYAGYWTREEDGQTRFVGIAITMVCTGFIDKETGCAVVDQYAFYDDDEDGTLDCDFYRNGLGCQLEDKNLGSHYITLSLNNGNLVFKGDEYQLLW